MLAPLRDYLRPKVSMSSPLLCSTRDRYFTRMSVKFDRSKPVFKESRWIASEDVNAEHLVDVFTSVDVNGDDVWDACFNYVTHIYWHKPRRTVLGQKIEGLPDDHRHKIRCLYGLAWLFHPFGNYAEQKRLLNLALKLQRERVGERWVALILSHLCEANRMLGLYKEGIEQAREALEIHRRLGDKAEQAECLISLTRLLHEDKQLDAAMEAAYQVIVLLPEGGQEFQVCQSHRLLGDIHRSKGEKETVIRHLEAALAIASLFDWQDQLCWVNYILALLFLDWREFRGAHTHIEKAKSHAINDAYGIGRVLHLEALIWYQQGRLKEAKARALRSFEAHRKLGAVKDVEACICLLQNIEGRMKNPSTSDDPGSNGEFPKCNFHVTPIDSGSPPP